MAVLKVWHFWIVAILALFWTEKSQCATQDLCSASGCDCQNLNNDLIQVNCQCSDGQSLSLGPDDGTPYSDQISLVPITTSVLNVRGCQKLEILSKSFNNLPNLSNVSFSDVHTVILHSRVYEARVGNGQSKPISSFEMENIQDLQVKRHTFEGVQITGSFQLKNVIVQRTPSLAFAFDSVNEFTILSSRFDRVSMWGFKLEDCNEFNALGNSRFFSLASQAFHMKCQKFMLAYNTFDNLQDSSLGVMYGVADIQGNTFEKLTGKPFVDLRPLIETNPDQVNSGFIFSSNKFACEPALPFNAFAMPSFDSIDNPNAFVDINNNHFTCECDKMSWFLGAMTHNFDRDVIANGRGSLDFLQKLYDTAGNCLSCGLRRCDETETPFHEFSQSALMVHKGQLKCSSSGQPLKSQKPGRENNFANFAKTGEEEGLAESRNQEFLNNSPTMQSLNLFTLIVMALICMKFN